MAKNDVNRDTRRLFMDLDQEQRHMGSIEAQLLECLWGQNKKARPPQTGMSQSGMSLDLRRRIEATEYATLFTTVLSFPFTTVGGPRRWTPRNKARPAPTSVIGSSKDATTLDQPSPHGSPAVNLD